MNLKTLEHYCIRLQRAFGQEGRDYNDDEVKEEEKTLFTLFEAKGKHHKWAL